MHTIKFMPSVLCAKYSVPAEREKAMEADPKVDFQNTVNYLGMLADDMQLYGAYTAELNGATIEYDGYLHEVAMLLDDTSLPIEDLETVCHQLAASIEELSAVYVKFNGEYKPTEELDNSMLLDNIRYLEDSLLLAKELPIKLRNIR